MVRHPLNLLIRLLIVAVIGFVGLSGPSEAARPSQALGAQAPAAGKAIYLPMIYGRQSGPSPAGTYDCYETEFSQIWTTEVITLSVDGSSIYAYNPPYQDIVAGTWVYTPTAQEVGFTNFRWITATVELPNRLSAHKYLSGPGFEIGLSCARRATVPGQ
jgi:hypothetical protein